MKHNNFIFINPKYIMIFIVLVLVITYKIVTKDSDGSITMSASALYLQPFSDTQNETAKFINKVEKGLVIEEKIDIDLNYIFSSKNELKYNTEIISVKIEPKDDSADYTTLNKGSEISVLGYNIFGYAKILLDNKEFYIKNENLIDNIDELTYSYNTMTFKEDGQLFDTVKLIMPLNEVPTAEPAIMLLSTDEEVQTLKYMADKEYMIGEDGVTTYYTNNMYNGVFAEVPESEITEENIIFLAKLIHCEAEGHTEEGKLAVGTVVVNRLFDGRFGDTIIEVIESPNQFSPVTTGKIYRTSYTDEDYDAAKKVLVDGYRSFPAYVFYFQSKGDGHFKGQNTYCVCYTEDKTYPQYFSYKLSDLDLYVE